MATQKQFLQDRTALLLTSGMAFLTVAAVILILLKLGGSSTGNYIVTFDGKKATGFYSKNDKGMEHNLIAQRNTEMNLLEQRCKAFLQDYMEKVMDKKLGGVTAK